MSRPRPYHHGDLRRALIGAARHLLEAEGEGALSLRAAAREAGVSPAAPYHHFRDKGELLAAVAEEGYVELTGDLQAAGEGAPPGRARMTALGAAYAGFALRRRALYQVMVSNSRAKTRATDGAAMRVARLMRDAVADSCAPGASELDVQLASLATWAAIHGLADLAAFPLLEPMKARVGGEDAFLRAVLDRLGVFADQPVG